MCSPPWAPPTSRCRGCSRCADDPDVVGAPFYAMAEVDGVVYREPDQTAELALHSAGPRRRARRRPAPIHAVDLDATGLRDFGRPDGYVERQLRRWTRPVGGQPHPRRRRHATSSSTRLGRQRPADGEITPGARRLPPGQHPRDASPDGIPGWPRSWTGSCRTLGDPLADLAMWLTYWSGPGEDGSAVPVAPGLTAHEGFPTSGRDRPAVCRADRPRPGATWPSTARSPTGAWP